MQFTAKEFFKSWPYIRLPLFLPNVHGGLCTVSSIYLQLQARQKNNFFKHALKRTCTRNEQLSNFLYESK